MPTFKQDFADCVVALRKESVDRNTVSSSFALLLSGSLSARRAWIEILAAHCQQLGRRVALRKESVDRNCDFLQLRLYGLVALRKESVDRNIAPPALKVALSVALRKESVDRNLGGWTCSCSASCRSPQGERG